MMVIYMQIHLNIIGGIFKLPQAVCNSRIDYDQPLYLTDFDFPRLLNRQGILIQSHKLLNILGYRSGKGFHGCGIQLARRYHSGQTVKIKCIM